MTTNFGVNNMVTGYNTALPDRVTKLGSTKQLTNLDTSADTWGKFIPITWGMCRVAGALVWASPFYKSVDTFRTTTQFRTTEWPVIIGENGASTTHKDYDGNSSTTAVETIYIDLAYSFGFNGDLRIKRTIKSMRINDVIVYNATDGITVPDLAFSIRDEHDLTIDPIMAAYPETGKYFYPGQTLVIFDRFPLSQFGDKIPQTIDIEYGCINAPIVIDPPDGGGGVDPTYYPNNDVGSSYTGPDAYRWDMIRSQDVGFAVGDLITCCVFLTKTAAAVSHPDDPNWQLMSQSDDGVLVARVYGCIVDTAMRERFSHGNFLIRNGGDPNFQYNGVMAGFLNVWRNFEPKTISELDFKLNILTGSGGPPTLEHFDERRIWQIQGMLKGDPEGDYVVPLFQGTGYYNWQGRYLDVAPGPYFALNNFSADKWVLAVMSCRAYKQPGT